MQGASVPNGGSCRLATMEHLLGKFDQATTAVITILDPTAIKIAGV